MKPTTMRSLLLAATLALPGTVNLRRAAATPMPPPIIPFAGTFFDHGSTIDVAGFVHLNVLTPNPPPISPQGPQPPPIRFHANLLNVQAINRDTGETFTGVGTWTFEGAGPFPNSYSFTALF